MPIAYQCFVCDRYFMYKSVRVRTPSNKDPNHLITIEIQCKQPTYGTLGSTGDDYVCGDCIEKTIRMKGLS